MHLKERTVIPPQQVSEATRLLAVDLDTIGAPPPGSHREPPSFLVGSAHILVSSPTSYLDENWR